MFIENPEVIQKTIMRQRILHSTQIVSDCYLGRLAVYDLRRQGYQIEADYLQNILSRHDPKEPQYQNLFIQEL